MKHYLAVLIFVLSCVVVTGQNPVKTVEGKVSYVTSQNVYVKFQSTENIKPGDTLFNRRQGTLIPVVIVKEISSISCVCIPVAEEKLTVGELLISKLKELQTYNPVEKTTVPVIPSDTARHDTTNAGKQQTIERKQIITGNISVASYLNFSNVASNSERMKYTFAMNLENIGNSKLSAETYITFVHKLGEWSTVYDEIFNGLKIYSLALNYAFNKNNVLWFGRKINPRISSVGAIDGLQYELKTGSFTVGVITGSRPDYMNYGFDFSLFQFGGYVGHDFAGKNGSMQTTIAFFDQTNSGLTDRRFVYLQHTNSLLRNLYFFGSAEIDLYKQTMNPVDSVVKDTTYKKDHSPALSNLYLSLRYRPVRQLSLSVSYSSRQNVIYYETYKNIVDKLMESATVQGFVCQVNYQPVKLLSIGIQAGYRDSKRDPRPTKNLYGYVTYNKVPGINSAATISATFLETSYLSGRIYSLGISRDLVTGKLSATLNYRYVSYGFLTGEADLAQNMGEVNVNWRILKKLSCGLYYEGTFDKISNFTRVYINITQRF
jgi:hypothetical protein